MMENIGLKRIVVYFLILLSMNVYVYSQNKEAFELYYLPATKNVIIDGKDSSFSCLPLGFRELNGKIYFNTRNGILVLDELTKTTELITKSVLPSGDTDFIYMPFESDIIIQKPYSSSICFHDMYFSYTYNWASIHQDTNYITPFFVLDSGETYPRAIQFQFPQYPQDYIERLYAFPPKQLEAEYSPNDARLIYNSHVQTGAYLKSYTKILDTAFNIIDSIINPGYYNEFNTFVLADSFKLLTTSSRMYYDDTLMLIDLSTKEQHHLMFIDQDKRPFRLFSNENEVKKIVDLKTHILKRADSSYKDIFHFVFKNNILTRMPDIDLSNNSLFNKYKNDSIEWNNGAIFRKDNIVRKFESDVYYWNNDELIFGYYIGKFDNYYNREKIFSVMDDARRTFTILNCNTGEYRPFIIPKELFARNDYDTWDSLYNATKMTHYIVSFLSDGIRKGFLIKQYYGNDIGDIFIIYDPRKDTTLGIAATNELINIVVSPNPTEALITVTLDITTCCQLKITLNDLLGNELYTIYDGFEDIGTFTQSFSTTDLPTGTYYIIIEAGAYLSAQPINVIR